MKSKSKSETGGPNRSRPPAVSGQRGIAFEREGTVRILALLNAGAAIEQVMPALLQFMQQVAGCDAVGIRLHDGDDFPYYLSSGFPPDFLAAENRLCVASLDGQLERDDIGNPVLECMCGNIICGRFDPDKPFFTAFGSFVSNGTTRLLAATSEADRRARTRNRCNAEGYESVLLVPLRAGGETFGLLQFNDYRENRFPPRFVAHMENLAANVAIALAHRKVEQALRESEAKYRALVTAMPDIVMRLDRDGIYQFVSDGVRNLVACDSEQCLGKTPHQLGFPEELCRFLEEGIRRAFASGVSSERELALRRDDRQMVFNWRLVPEWDPQGGVVRSVLSIARDVSAHRKTESDYQTLFREMMNGFALHEIMCDAGGKPVDYRFLAVNPAFERMTGLSPRTVLGKTVLTVLPDTESYWIEVYGKVALTGEPVRFENYSREVDRWFEVSAFRPAPNQFACIFMDVTDRKRAETLERQQQERLVKADKLAALGTLAAGIAHEISNPVMFIMLNTPVIQAGVEDILATLAANGVPIGQGGTDSQGVGQSLRTACANVLQGAERIRNIVGEIKDYVREAPGPADEAVDLNQVVRAAVTLAGNTIKRTTDRFTEHYAMNLPTIRGRAQKLEQVVINLIVNACEALSDRGQAVSVETGFDPATRSLTLCVRDEGAGMTPDDLQQIREPFFTTKRHLGGIGMGVPIIASILAAHGGTIAYESEPGRGTLATVTLPVVPGGGSPGISSTPRPSEQCT